MSTKTRGRKVVEFYAASTRLLDAYDTAAKRTKSPARFPKLHQLDFTSKGRRDARLDRETMVVLSHADDDPSALIDSRNSRLVSKARHLLFMGPAAHPDQVVQWSRAARIRSDKRLIVCNNVDMDSPRLAQLLGRVRRALEDFEDKERSAGIVDAYASGDFLFVRGPDLRMLQVPISSVPAFKGRGLDDVRNFEIDDDGSFIYWPGLDVQLGWDQFLQMVDPAELQKARQRSKGFNECYGAAIRRVREEAGIPQSKIDGLTDRQLRRIEQGECRATSSAISALAKAHGLEPDAYMESVAKVLK